MASFKACLEVKNEGSGLKVLDMCSAPGGKATFLSQLLNDDALIVCRDIHEHRVKLITDNKLRLGINSIHEEVADSTVIKKEDYEAYDVVILDAPCSGLGIIRSKPDIKYHHNETDDRELISLQRKLFLSAARMVKKGGALIYSTCTLCKDENENQVAWFLENEKEFTEVDLQKSLPSIPECDRLFCKHITLLPKKNGHDGFFVARLDKKQ
jgi:16S rRNA (cytosine967-C5)-methyltransferase